MKAILCLEYGAPEIMKIREVEKPLPKADEVLIKIHATQVTAGDCNMRGFTYIPPGLKTIARFMLGYSKPRVSIQGTNLSGTIEAIGKDVRNFSVSDEVYGINSEYFGTYAEYVCWPSKNCIVHKPANTTHAQAASLPYGAGTALYFLRDLANIEPGQKVLVHGASGGVGIYAVQLAKYFGGIVTGVCSASNADFVKSLGADHVIDYSQEDFTKNGQEYDLIFDNVCGKASFKKCKKSLTPKGKYLAVAGGFNEMRQAMFNFTRSKKVIFGSPSKREPSLLFIKQLVEAGQLKPIIDKEFTLEQTAAANRYFESAHKNGSVVISVI